MPGFNYMPAREAEFMNWVQNLYDRLEATPEAYGQTVESVGDYAVPFNAFKAAFAKMSNPATKNKVTVQEKNTAKGALVSATRTLVAVTQAWPEMTDAKRDELDIPVRDTEPTPVPVPTEMPKLLVDPPLGTTAKFRVENQEGGRARPEGAAGVLVYSFLGDTAPADLGQWDFRGLSTKYKNELPFPAETTPGSRVYVTACWVNRRGQPGPACQPLSFNLPGGGVQQGFGQAA